MLSFLIFILVSVGVSLAISYFRWRSNGRPEGEYRVWLSSRWQQWRENRASDSPVDRRVIRSKDLPEAPPREPGQHDELSVAKSEREAEIERLNKLFGES